MSLLSFTKVPREESDEGIRARLHGSAGAMCDALLNDKEIASIREISLAFTSPQDGSRFDLSQFGLFPKLEYLYLDGFDFGATDNLLSDLPNIKSLSLDTCRGLRDLKQIACYSVESLAIHNCADFESSSGLEKFHNLQELAIHTSPLLKDISSITEIPQLKCLYMGQLSSLTDLSCLESLQNLHILHLYECSGITDFRPLTNLKSLKSLDLNLTGLANLTNFNQLKQLRYLDLKGCTNISFRQVATLHCDLPDCVIRNPFDYRIETLTGHWIDLAFFWYLGIRLCRLLMFWSFRSK